MLLSRLGDNSDSATQAVHGAEAANSPAEDYDDASLDFALVNDVVYQHINPGVGTSTHSHGTDIRCNFKIYYTVIINHGDLLGEGSVNAAHIDRKTLPPMTCSSGLTALAGRHGRLRKRCRRR